MRHNIRRKIRNILAATGIVALALAVAAPASAEAESELVGAPEHYVIENVHASGKVLEIGNDGAQATGPDAAWTAAAAIFARAETAADITAQAVVAYPVTGADRTYVFTNDAGEVLIRRANDDEYYRYLDLSSMTVDEAAADPYAQWKAVDAGNGAVYLQNVQRDKNGMTAALDMYNWKTDNGSEIQTYDAGTAAVQKWVMRSLTPVVDTFTARTESGVAPTLPTSATARYSWGLNQTLAPIEWQAIDETVWDADGTVVVNGTATGYFGEAVPVTAEYLVGSVGDARDTVLSSYVGVTLKELRMAAPKTVERTISGSDVTVTSPVAWDWSAVPTDATAREGTFTVPATGGTGFTANLVVTITAAEQVNILRTGGVHVAYTFKDGTTFALTDGVRNVTGFADWRSGGAANRVNPNSVSFYFDQPRQVTGAAVFDIAGKQNIGSVTVQYRDLIGGWVDLPASTTEWPYANTASDLSMTVDSEPVLASGMRVVFSNKTSDTWMTLSEIEVYGPAAAGK
ncbi:hypothetical protein FHX49_000969 [Microbacterium endophyticum]|uniref:Bacterial Ig-like domain-containing protein n=1 Tax=Microbacterium endophyticum TaxID=1526412 RepID=A0A7W4V216_9MICO|nr:Ig-like domain-containing protein [Microbacterium endophyticum]MBB2975403.1 hypothetical protein [Microbacterium endophyticum]NIK35578.1 hypothetical protein [Microbacterium endophyticum]